MSQAAHLPNYSINLAWYWSFLMLALPAFAVGGLLAAVGNLSDGVRLGALSALGSVAYYFAIQKKIIFIKILVGIWWFIFIIDSMIRSSSWIFYNSDIEATFIIQAIANSNSNEMYEYLSFNFYNLCILFILFLLIFSLYFYYIEKYIAKTLIDYKYKIHKTWLLKVLIGIFITLILLAYAIRPSRDLFPSQYWSNYIHKVNDFKNQVKNHHTQQKQWHLHATQTLTLEKKAAQKQTHVLIITESVTSYNFGVCGYERNTTPNLKSILNQVMVYCNAYSAYPSTIPSMIAKLTDKKPHHDSDQAQFSLISMAQASGYKVFWISNQDDLYINSLFAHDADQYHLINKRSGRSSYSLDGLTLPKYKEALNDNFDKKLIIVHLIGAHPNYSLRYPKGQYDAFNDDSIEKSLLNRFKNPFLAQQRNHYDQAVLYQDSLIGQFLQPLQQIHAKQNVKKSFIYISDHGNETGHYKSFAGHSPGTSSGYRVPMVFWSTQPFKTGVTTQKIDTSELDFNVLQEMGILTQEYNNMITWQNQDYQFKPYYDWPTWK